MHVKALNFPGMEVEVLAQAIEPPAPEWIVSALENLRMGGALDERKNLTRLKCCSSVPKFLPVPRPCHYPRRYPYQSRPIPQPAIAEERSQRVQNVVEPCQLPLRCASHTVCVQCGDYQAANHFNQFCRALCRSKATCRKPYTTRGLSQTLRGLCRWCGW